MEADEGQAVCLRVTGRLEIAPGARREVRVRIRVRGFGPDIKIAWIASGGDLLRKYVPNHPSNSFFFLQEGVVPEIGRDPTGPPRAG